MSIRMINYTGYAITFREMNVGPTLSPPWGWEFKNIPKDLLHKIKVTKSPQNRMNRLYEERELGRTKEGRKHKQYS